MLEGALAKVFRTKHDRETPRNSSCAADISGQTWPADAGLSQVGTRRRRQSCDSTPSTWFL